jgi:hypothetical protein
MAALADVDRAALHAQLMTACSRDRDEVALTKVELRAALDAADAWVEANKTAFNNALPAAAKANLTAAQKARLLAAVVLRRYEKGA